MTSRDHAVEALAQERWAALVGYAHLLTGSRADAEDVVQDALVKVVLRGRAGVDLDAAEAYARRAILTVFLDRDRRRRRWARASTAQMPADHGRDPAGPTAARLDLQAALALLSPRERACVVLRHLEDLSVAETAAHLGVSTGAVKKYTSTAMARLEATLGPLETHETAAVDRTVNR